MDQRCRTIAATLAPDVLLRIICLVMQKEAYPIFTVLPKLMLVNRHWSDVIRDQKGYYGTGRTAVGNLQVELFGRC